MFLERMEPKSADLRSSAADVTTTLGKVAGVHAECDVEREGHATTCAGARDVARSDLSSIFLALKAFACAVNDVDVRAVWLSGDER